MRLGCFILASLLSFRSIGQESFDILYLDKIFKFSKFHFPTTDDPLQYKEFLDTQPFNSFVSEIKKISKEYALGDWYTYRLINAVAESVYGQEQYNLITFFNWYALSKLGYDSRILPMDEYYALYVYSLDSALSTLCENDRCFTGLNISYKPDQRVSEGISLNEQGIGFNFRIKSLPTIGKPMKDSYDYFINNDQHSFPAMLPTLLLFHLHAYPDMNDIGYLINQDFSNVTETSLVSELKKLSNQKTDLLRLSFLFDFIKWNFGLDDDCLETKNRAFPEQLLSYTSGCLFGQTGFLYAIVREGIQVEMIIIQGKSSNEVLLGAYLEGESYKGPVFDGKKYLVCDLRKPKLEPLADPGDFAGFKVIGRYIPGTGYLNLNQRL